MTGDQLEGVIQRIGTWRRRRKLACGYSKVAEAELGKSVGFSPIMRKWQLMERDGYIEADDGGRRWVWPPDAE